MWRFPWFGRHRDDGQPLPDQVPAEPGWRRLPPLHGASTLQPVIEVDEFQRMLAVSRPVAVVDGVTNATTHLADAAAPAPRSPQVFASAPLRPRTAARGVDGESDPPPVVVRRAVERETGTPLNDVPVHRGREARAVTEALGARAATVDQEVFIPDVAGALTLGTGAALLAHELVHVAQQRRLGSTLADSAIAPRLEREARGVERRVAAAPDDPSRATGFGAPAAWLTPLSESLDEAAPIFAREDVRRPTPSWPAASPPGQLPRWGGERQPDAQAGREVWPSIALPLVNDPSGTDDPDPTTTALTREPARSVPDFAAARPESTHTSTTTPVSAAPAPPPAPVARPGAAQGAPAAAGSAAPNPQAELDELARRLYPSLRDRLKAELRLDRERAGRITDLPA
jgi:hypothetical protein